MTRRLIQNFRGLRAVLSHVSDRDYAVLAETLTRLGLQVSTINPDATAPAARDILASADLLFFDADVAETPFLTRNNMSRVPIVAIIGLETPTRLQRAFELAPTAVLHKPLRSSGVYSALFFAANEHRRRLEMIDRLKALEERHSARRFVQKALLRLMELHKCNDEEAFRILRRESMRQRITVEELAMRVLAADPPRATSNA